MSTRSIYPGRWQPIRYEERCRKRRAALDDALARAVAICRSRSDIERLVVFGSYARGDVSAWSDLDLLVVVEGGVADATDTTDALNAVTGFADVLGMRAADADARLATTPLGRTILREGRVVYARPSV